MLNVHHMHTLVCRVFKWNYEQQLYGYTFLPTDIMCARANSPLMCQYLTSLSALKGLVSLMIIMRCNTVNVVIFAGGKFHENVSKTFHVGVIFTIILIFFDKVIWVLVFAWEKFLQRRQYHEKHEN